MVIRDEDENLTNYITNGDKDVIACRTCGISRWKVDNKTYKVYENIPAKVKWITDGVLRHPADSQAWRTIDEKFPEIAKDPKNLRLGISADGVDVNTGNRHHNDVRVGKARRAWGCSGLFGSLRLVQKSDPEKHVSLRRILLEARVKTHERQLVVALWI
ncbi:glutamate receptor 2.8-like protein [Tanacetum coccineum]